MTKDMRDALQKVYDAFDKGRRDKFGRLRLTRSEGDHLWFAVSEALRAPSRDDGWTQGMIAAGYDLSKYAACSKERNTPEFLEGLFDKVRHLQNLYFARHGKPETGE